MTRLRLPDGGTFDLAGSTELGAADADLALVDASAPRELGSGAIWDSAWAKVLTGALLGGVLTWLLVRVTANR